MDPNFDVTSLYGRRAVHRWERTSVGDLLERVTWSFPDKDAIVGRPGAYTDERFRRLTYRLADELANQVANGLLARGLRRGDVISMFCENTVEAFITKLDRQVAVAEDFPAFIVNRILLPMINEAVYTLYEGVGSVDSIDTAMRLGANHPMGPLELADFIGLDVCLSVMQVLYDGLADSKYRPCPLLVKYVEAGWLGKKTKRGFYDYSTEVPTPTR